jgi:aryl-alcohol dehydrogenase-like predicted oxidoreductase
MAQDRQSHWLSERLRDRVDELVAYSDEVKVPMLTFAFSWLLNQPAVASVIAGASNAEQVRANAQAVTELTDAQLSRLNELTANL